MALLFTFMHQIFAESLCIPKWRQLKLVQQNPIARIIHRLLCNARGWQIQTIIYQAGLWSIIYSTVILYLNIELLFTIYLWIKRYYRRRHLYRIIGRSSQSKENRHEPHEQTSESEQEESIKAFTSNIKSRSSWLRLFFMLVVALLYGISRIVTGGVIVLLFSRILFTGGINIRLWILGQALATHTYQIILYLTFNSEQRPFPFDINWPAGPPSSWQ